MEFRLVEYPGINGYIIEGKGEVESKVRKLSKSTPSSSPWICISNWSSPEERAKALTTFQHLASGGIT